MATLFISDLHLTAEQPELIELFGRFLSGPAREAEALYILGDLFEAWLGDDLILPPYQRVIEWLRQLHDGGVALYLLHGNRDFLLGERFSQLSGTELLDDPSVIDLYGTSTLLMHGDLLCSDDTRYQQLRQMVRDPAWIEQFLAKSPEERIAFARQLREQSREETGSKAEQIMDVNPQTVTDYLARYGVSRLIHGHTHRPARHRLPGGAERIVLADWGAEGHYLRCDGEGCREERFS